MDCLKCGKALAEVRSCAACGLGMPRVQATARGNSSERPADPATRNLADSEIEVFVLDDVVATPGPGRGRRMLTLLASCVGVCCVGAVILGLVLLVTVTQDRFEQDAGRVRNEEVRLEADQAFKDRRFRDALRGYETIAAQTTGEVQQRARRNASVSALELAEAELSAGRAEAAEAAARQAIKLHRGSGLPYVTLGRALANRGEVEAGIEEIDHGIRIARRDGDSESIGVARAWKAKLLYSDGEKLLVRAPLSAERRFEQVIEDAPGTAFAANAEAYLKQLKRRR